MVNCQAVIGPAPTAFEPREQPEWILNPEGHEHGVLSSTADLDAVVTCQAVIGPAPTAFEPHAQPKRILSLSALIARFANWVVRSVFGQSTI
jgi:hypothetical protein